MTHQPAHTIDTLGEIKTQIAELQLIEKSLKAELEDLEPGIYEGNLFRLQISVADRETLDMTAVREHLSRQFIAAHTNVTEVRTLRTTVRSARSSSEADLGLRIAASRS